MKRIFAILASLAVLCFASCEWLDPDYEPAGTSTEEKVSFWDVVGQLVDVRDITPDYEGKTFKPVIGSPDGGDESVRIVAVNDLDAAVARFNNLTKAGIDGNTQTYTFEDKSIGTLTWEKDDSGKAWATVDVNIAAVPTLQKIIYRSPEQGDVNGSVGDGGSAYYRFGDVIQRMSDDDSILEYWICVRPSFDPEGKGKSHWVCVGPLPNSNIWPYNDKKKNGPFVASNGMEYGLPDEIREDPEWYQDLAEMLFAIMYPQDWINNIGSYYTENVLHSPNGLRMFNDFHQRNIRYHNLEFWKNVQKQWKEKDLVQKLFGVSYDDMAKAIKPDGTGRGIHFLYSGYSWNTVTSNKPKLFQIHYSHGAKNTEKNLHKQTKTTVQSQVVVPRNQTESNINYSFNFYNLYLYRPYMTETRFFGDDAPRWVIRYATGEELSANGRYDPQQPISGITKQDEIYRYYRDVFSDKNLTDEPEETMSEESKYTGMTGYFTPGCIVQDEEGSKWFCYYSWSDVGNGVKTRDHYSRFISFDNIKTTGLATDGVKYITNTDIMPEREAPLAALALSIILDDDERSNFGKSQKFIDMRAHLQQLCDFYTNNRVLTRDTLFKVPGRPDQEYLGRINSISVAYQPVGSNFRHSLPYLRFVYDASALSAPRTLLPEEMKYGYGQFFKYYNCESPSDPNKGRMLSLYDLFFKTTQNITLEHSVKSDKWSRCVRHDDQKRDGDFKYSDLIPGDVDCSQFTRARWTNAYHEPVILARYMQVDDPYQDQAPLYSTDKHRLTILYDPVADHNDKAALMSQGISLRGAMDGIAEMGYAEMDGEKYDMGIYTKQQ